jgi:hypothetical protein
MKTHHQGMWQEPNPLMTKFKMMMGGIEQNAQKAKKVKKFKIKVKEQVYPKNIVAGTGEIVNIVWKVKNVGKMTWPDGTRVILDDGMFEFEDAFIPEVKSGEVFDISVNVNVGLSEGVYLGTWRLVIGNKVFGKLKARVRCITDRSMLVLVRNMGFDYPKAKLALASANGELNLAVSQILMF